MGVGVLGLPAREGLVLAATVDASSPVLNALQAASGVGHGSDAVDGHGRRAGIGETEGCGRVHTRAVHKDHAGRVHEARGGLGRQHIEVARSLVDPMELLEHLEVSEEAHGCADQHRREGQAAKNHLVAAAEPVVVSNVRQAQKAQHQRHEPQHAVLTIGTCDEVTHQDQRKQQPGQQHQFAHVDAGLIFAVIPPAQQRLVGRRPGALRVVILDSPHGAIGTVASLGAAIDHALTCAGPGAAKELGVGANGPRRRADIKVRHVLHSRIYIEQVVLPCRFRYRTLSQILA
mmetsp:Transcript_36265/g.86778  ORF Transcript_36265/g.86778 Transcript_36265/m.86778 type:complete len:289 (+) Transcript_36265:358-1224(+)